MNDEGVALKIRGKVIQLFLIDLDSSEMFLKEAEEEASNAEALSVAEEASSSSASALSGAEGGLEEEASEASEEASEASEEEEASEEAEEASEDDIKSLSGVLVKAVPKLYGDIHSLKKEYKKVARKGVSGERGFLLFKMLKFATESLKIDPTTGGCTAGKKVKSDIIKFVKAESKDLKSHIKKDLKKLQAESSESGMQVDSPLPQHALTPSEEEAVRSES